LAESIRNSRFLDRFLRCNKIRPARTGWQPFGRLNTPSTPAHQGRQQSRRSHIQTLPLPLVTNPARTIKKHARIQMVVLRQGPPVQCVRIPLPSVVNAVSIGTQCRIPPRARPLRPPSSFVKMFRRPVPQSPLPQSGQRVAQSLSPAHNPPDILGPQVAAAHARLSSRCRACGARSVARCGKPNGQDLRAEGVPGAAWLNCRCVSCQITLFCVMLTGSAPLELFCRRASGTLEPLFYACEQNY